MVSLISSSIGRLRQADHVAKGKARPKNPTLFDSCVESLMSHRVYTGPTVYSPYPRKREIKVRTICGCNYKGSTFFPECWSGQSQTHDLPHSSSMLNEVSHRCLLITCIFGHIWAQGAKVPKLYGPFSGVTIPFVTQERTAFNTSNFTVIFLFVTLKTC